MFGPKQPGPPAPALGSMGADALAGGMAPAMPGPMGGGIMGLLGGGMMDDPLQLLLGGNAAQEMSENTPPPLAGMGQEFLEALLAGGMGGMGGGMPGMPGMGAPMGMGGPLGGQEMGQLPQRPMPGMPMPGGKGGPAY